MPHQTLVEAAAVAAYYSKGQDATAVEVIYTQAKHVRKFRGARPGQVRVRTYQTLEVTPRLPEAS
jgi:predicted ribosome quality control (RQC) complex YloA/Tae2 family protein